MLSAAPRASLTLPSCSPNYPRVSRIGWTHVRHCPFLKFNAPYSNSLRQLLALSMMLLTKHEVKITRFWPSSELFARRRRSRGSLIRQKQNKGSSQNYYTLTGPTKPQNSWWCLPAPPCLRWYVPQNIPKILFTDGGESSIVSDCTRE